MNKRDNKSNLLVVKKMLYTTSGIITLSHITSGRITYLILYLTQLKNFGSFVEIIISSKYLDFLAASIVQDIKGLPKKIIVFLFLILVEPFLAGITHKKVFLLSIFFYNLICNIRYVKSIQMKFKDIFLIAEIGINHNGSMSNVYKLIDMAKSCGCDAVKFQKRDPEITTPENQKNVIRETPWGKITYLDYKKKIELSSTYFKNIQSYCKKKKIICFVKGFE